MTRHLRITRLFWSASIAAEMEYRSNFVLTFVTSAMMLGGAVLTLAVLFQHDYQMGGWTWPQALMVVAIYTILDGFQQTFLAPNRTRITELVREGTLDFVLLKPIDSQFWLSVYKISIWGLPNLVLGVAMLIYAGMRTRPPLDAGDYALGLPMIVLGVAILYALGYMLSTLTVWFIKMNNITYAMAALLEAGRYPIPAYPLPYRVFFTFVLPVAFMTTVPAQTMLGMSGSAVWIVGSLGVAVVMLIAARLFWRFALRYYTSASS